jgi:hypothetical protein
MPAPLAIPAAVSTAIFSQKLLEIGVKSITDATPKVVESVMRSYIAKKQIDASIFHAYIESANPSLSSLYSAITEIVKSHDQISLHVLQVIQDAQGILRDNMNKADSEDERAAIRLQVIQLVDKAREESDSGRTLRQNLGWALCGVAVVAVVVGAKVMTGGKVQMPPMGTIQRLLFEGARKGFRI